MKSRRVSRIGSGAAPTSIPSVLPQLKLEFPTRADCNLPGRRWHTWGQGEPGDTMYFILEGELRVRINVAGKETILATLGAGEFFGDISLFDQGPRSADVVANADSLLVKISSRAFDELAKEAPELATPFLRAIGKTLTARIRADNKRYGDSVKFARAAE